MDWASITETDVDFRNVLLALPVCAPRGFNTYAGWFRNDPDDVPLHAHSHIYMMGTHVSADTYAQVYKYRRVYMRNIYAHTQACTHTHTPYFPALSAQRAQGEALSAATDISHDQMVSLDTILH